MKLAASFAVEIDCLQYASIRADSDVCHPMLSASYDARGKPRGDDPICGTACFAGPRPPRVASTSTQTSV